ncbi:hypothetical protein KEM56_000716, partial [Ascosphaera pollenicola]
MTVQVGSRLSYDGSLCTVRYIGDVQGTKGQWLGVEWDDPTRGKHAGEHNGVQYFTCRSRLPTAGSFVRPSRPADKPRGFLEAVRQKYVSGETSAEQPKLPGMAGVFQPILFNGKVAEEVGFDKIRQKMSELQELKIVLVDGYQVSGVLPDVVAVLTEEYERELQNINKTMPKITELDLSRNLLDSWRQVNDICRCLPKLKSLRLIGNRFNKLDSDVRFEHVTELYLDETLMTWEEMASVAHRFFALQKLAFSSNGLTSSSQSLPETITELRLDYNEFNYIDCLRPLTNLTHLTRLSLRGNNIQAVFSSESASEPLVFPPSLIALDVSFNRIDSWSFVDQLPKIFPGLKTLRISDNALYMQPPISAEISGVPEKAMTIDEAYMLTLARIGQLENLNYSHIDANDRQNGELYYLSLIRKELGASPVEEEESILQKHPRFHELCKAYGKQQIDRVALGPDAVNPRSLAARLVNITFYLPSSGQTVRKEVPKTLDVYAVKSFVARKFGLPALTFRLVWETEEWDPVFKEDVDEDEWDSEDDDNSTQTKGEDGHDVKEQGGQKF